MFKYFATVMLTIFHCLQTSAQFIDQFDSGGSAESRGWNTVSGDGNVDMQVVQADGYASVTVDATKDKRNLWWAVLRKEISGININLLSRPDYELRSEARIRVSHAPRRVNLHFNHQRTTDFHSHLMEYDIADTGHWQLISLTTKNFDVQPGDRINAQMAMIDWGLEKYRVDIDYFKVDVVHIDSTGPDLGTQLPYHPPLEDPQSFAHHLSVNQNATIDLGYPDMNFSSWQSSRLPGSNLLHLGGDQIIILRWNMAAYENAKITRSGILEIPVYSVQRSADFSKDFGMVRICEIIGGTPDWDQQKVTWDSFSQGKRMEYVINEQMTIDYKILPNEQGRAYFTISYPVLQRMIEGKTLGLAIKPLGAISASFYDARSDDSHPLKLHFDTER